MAFTVLLTDDAAQDLEELYLHIARQDGWQKAEYILDRIEKAIASFSEYPERGCYPYELSSVGIREYREIFFKPYRIIYRFVKDSVHIYLIADGRRNMQSLLERRLLHA